MKIKHNGKVILITLLALLLFGTLVIWHDKPGRDMDLTESQQLIQKLTQGDADFRKFVEQGSKPAVKGFYIIGIPGSQTWPRDVLKACYSDPVALRAQFSGISSMISNELELIRYRSIADLLDLLHEAEDNSPGYLAQLDFKSHVLISEKQLSLSYRSIAAILTGILGLFVVGMIQGKN